MTKSQSQAHWYFLLAIGVVFVAVAGYSGYVFYPRFDLPALSGIGLLVLAAAAGIASFFSPCSFPLLVTLLARPAGVTNGRKRAVSRPFVFRFALAFALGATVFLLLAGGIIALGGDRLFAGVAFTSVPGRIIRTVVGVALIILGLAQVGVIRLPFDRVAVAASRLLPRRSQLQQRPSLWGYTLYGFGYLLAGFG